MGALQLVVRPDHVLRVDLRLDPLQAVIRPPPWNEPGFRRCSAKFEYACSAVHGNAGQFQPIGS
jgi:hypothetical protein